MKAVRALGGAVIGIVAYLVSLAVGGSVIAGTTTLLGMGVWMVWAVWLAGAILTGWPSLLLLPVGGTIAGFYLSWRRQREPLARP